MYVITDTAPRKARAMHARGRDQAEPNGSPTQNPTPPVSGPPLTSPYPIPQACNHRAGGRATTSASESATFVGTRQCVGHNTPHNYSTQTHLTSDTTNWN